MILYFLKPCLNNTETVLVTLLRRTLAKSKCTSCRQQGKILQFITGVIANTGYLCLSVCLSIYLYIKENRTPLSPWRLLIGSSRDFTCEHGSPRGWKWSWSDVDCSFLIKVIRENSVNVLNLFIVLSDLYTEGSVVASAANVIGCGCLCRFKHFLEKAHRTCYQQSR